LKFLGVDPGGKRFGVAFGDDSTGLVIPVGVHPHHGIKPTADRLIHDAQTRGAVIIVLGLPTSEDGKETPACRRTRALAEALKQRGSQVHLQAEFLTTHAARARAREIGRSRDLPVDDLAAQIILEEFFSRRSATTRHQP